jgi:hypothetical protein
MEMLKVVIVFAVAVMLVTVGVVKVGGAFLKILI